MSTVHHPAPSQSFQYPGTSPWSSSRSSYPTFLSVQDSVVLQLTWAWRGLYDAFRWNVVFSAVMSDPEIRANVYKSLVLNSVSLLSIYVFDLLLLPLVQGQTKSFQRNIGWFYQVLWLVPLVGTSLYLNGTWCTIIAKRTFLLQHGGRPVAAQPTSYTGMLKAIATSAYRIVMVCTSMVVSYALSKVPLVGPPAGFIFLCWVDAYYCFEFVWISRGLSLARRIRHLEERWAYYFAFGLPSAAICSWGIGLANAALFALVFPFYIIMAMNARPGPADPYNPMPPASSSSASGRTPTSGEPEVIRHPSPFVPTRIPIFAPVIWLNDGIVRVLNAIGARPIVRHKEAAETRNWSRRGVSDDVDSSERAEDGSRAAQMEMRAFSRTGAGAGERSATPPVATNPAVRPASGRVKIGTRKLD